MPYQRSRCSGRERSRAETRRRTIERSGKYPARFTRGTSTFDALIFGYYHGNDLIYVARTRNGFTPAIRRQLFRQFQPLWTDLCPFLNLPEARSRRWGQGLTKAKMAECQWLEPVLVGQFEFWSGRPTITSGIRGSWVCARTELRRTWRESERIIDADDERSHLATQPSDGGPPLVIRFA